MKELSATYGIELSQCVYAKAEEESAYHFTTRINDYQVEIDLRPQVPGQTISRVAEKEIQYCLWDIEIKVAKEVPDEIFDVLRTKERDNLGEHRDYILELDRQYKVVAKKAFKHLFLFLKYSLGTPLLGRTSDYDKDFINPMWTDTDGKIVPPIFRVHRIENDFLNYSDKLGVKMLTAQMGPDVDRALQIETAVELYREILHDAQSAVFEGNYRRAVLEMAMASEIAIKQTYFENSTVPGRAFEFMEEKQKIDMKVTDYICGVARYAFGETFEDASTKSDFINIQYLFRGRNKIVHQGELSFRDDKARSHAIDFATILGWWSSVERLIAWLESKKSTRNGPGELLGPLSGRSDVSVH